MPLQKYDSINKRKMQEIFTVFKFGSELGKDGQHGTI